MAAQKPKRLQFRRIPWARLLIAIASSLLCAMGALLLILSTGHVIANYWYYILPTVFTVIGLIIPLLQWLFPISTEPMKVSTTSPSQLLSHTHSSEQSLDLPLSLWYVPYFRNPLFQSRPGEFERLERVLRMQEAAQTPVRLGLVGMVGMGGVGKTQLAVELAYRYRQDFPDGVFWMTATGISFSDWQHQLAELAFRADYLPSEDDPSHPENEARRAHHLCHYLATHSRALLILDNVEDPTMIASVLPALAGGELACIVLYTSRSRLAPPGVEIHSVEQLPEEGALCLLLETSRPSLLTEILAGSQSTEACAARTVCEGVGYLPLALTHLHSLLVRDQHLRLTRLADELKRRGALELAQMQQGNVQPLFTTFRLSWEKVRDEEAQRLLKLASYFPEATPIPLWLLGLAAGLGESGDIFEPLGKACVQLQELSLLEALAGEQVRLHPLVRQFAQQLVTEEGHGGEILLNEAGARLAAEFTDLYRLEDRARREGYWRCLEQTRDAYAYASLLGGTHHAEQLRRIERWLDREGYLLGDKGLWPKRVPGLFYQQLFNRSVEEGYPILARKAPRQWLRQIGRVGAKDQALLRVFTGHTERVTSVVFSPDGTKVLTGSDDQTARLWEVASGKILATLIGHTSNVMGAAFSPDGTKILTGSHDRTARLWEAASGKVLMKFLGHTNQVTSVAFSPDGTKVLTGSKDQTVRLWEAASGTLLATLLAQENHHRGVTSVAFSPDGTKILAGSGDNRVRLWETARGTLLLSLLTVQEKYGIGVTSVAFSPDGTKILTCTWGENDMLQVWEGVSGSLLTTLTAETSRKTGGITSAVFSPDGTKVLAGFWDGIARLWEVAGGRELVTLRGHERWITSVAFSPDGTKALTGGIDHTARLWELAKGSLLMPLPEGHTDQVMSVVFSPDGTKILTGSSDRTVRLWETTSGALLTTLTPKRGDSPWAVFSSDGTKVLANSLGLISLWDGVSGRPLATLTDYIDTEREGVKFSPDGTRVLAASKRDHAVRLWETVSGKMLVELLGHTEEVTGVMFSPDGTKALTRGRDFKARLWETASGNLLMAWGEHPAQISVSGAAFSPDGLKVFLCRLDGAIELWEIASGTILMTGQGYPEGAEKILFSPDGTSVLVCYLKSPGEYYEIPSGEVVVREDRSEAMMQGEKWISDHDAHPGFQHRLVLWEIASGRRLTLLESHTSRIPFMTFSPDGHFLITCDSQGYVFFWEVSGERLGSLLGIYVAAHQVMAVHWQSSRDLLLADWGGLQCYPYLYRLKLEGMD